jgi:hypothetical protein
MSLLVYAPLLSGGAIYLLFREKCLLMFEWVRYLGLYPLLSDYRSIFGHYEGFLPDWVIYSLPYGLWCCSLSAFLSTLWCKSNIFSQVIVLGFIMSVTIAPEVGQLLGIVSGTFDTMDLAICFAGTSIGIFSIYFTREGKYYER